MRQTRGRRRRLRDHQASPISQRGYAHGCRGSVADRELFLPLDVAHAAFDDRVTHRDIIVRSRLTVGHRPISVTDPMITARDRVITARDRVVTARDRAITARDRAITARDPAITTRDRAITRSHRMIEAGVEEITARDRMYAARDQTLITRHNAVIGWLSITKCKLLIARVMCGQRQATFHFLGSFVTVAILDARR